MKVNNGDNSFLFPPTRNSNQGGGGGATALPGGDPFNICSGRDPKDILEECFQGG